MTQITLRKALKLKRQIESALKPPSAQVSLDIDDRSEIEAFVEAKQQTFLAEVADYQRLSKLLAMLRLSIDKANADEGISANLSEIGHIDRMIALHKTIVDVKPSQVDILKARLERKREQMKVPQTSSYGHVQTDTNSLSVCPVSSSVAESFRTSLNNLRQRKEALEDSRLAINARVVIEIGDDELAFLAERGIV